MALKHSTGLKNYNLTSGFKSAFDTNGRINIYTGSIPSTGDTAATGTLLGTLTLSSTAFGSAASGTVTANAIASDTSADAPGTPGWFMCYNSTETAPGSAATSSDKRLLGVAGVKTTIPSSLNSTDTTITVGSTSGFPSSGSIVIDSEIITYTGVTSTTFTGCTRGASGSTAATHTGSTTVFQSGCDLCFDNASFVSGGFVAGGVIAVSSFSYSHGA